MSRPGGMYAPPPPPTPYAGAMHAMPSNLQQSRGQAGTSQYLQPFPPNGPPPANYMYPPQPQGAFMRPEQVHGPPMNFQHQSQPSYDMPRPVHYPPAELPPPASPYDQGPSSKGVYRQHSQFHNPQMSFNRGTSVPQSMLPMPQGQPHPAHMDSAESQTAYPPPPGPPYYAPHRKSGSVSSNVPSHPSMRPIPGSQMSIYPGQHMRMDMASEGSARPPRERRRSAVYRPGEDREQYREDYPHESAPHGSVNTHSRERRESGSSSVSPSQLDPTHEESMLPNYGREGGFPPVTRRLAHSQSEQKRREVINEGFAALASVLPSARGGADSKATILRKAVMHIESLHADLDNLYKGRLISPSSGHGESRRNDAVGQDTPGRPQPIHMMTPGAFTSPLSGGPYHYPGPEYDQVAENRHLGPSGEEVGPVNPSMEARRSQSMYNPELAQRAQYQTPHRERMHGTGPYGPYGSGGAFESGHHSTPSRYGPPPFSYPPQLGLQPEPTMARSGPGHSEQTGMYHPPSGESSQYRQQPGYGEPAAERTPYGPNAYRASNEARAETFDQQGQHPLYAAGSDSGPPSSRKPDAHMSQEPFRPEKKPLARRENKMTSGTWPSPRHSETGNSPSKADVKSILASPNLNSHPYADPQVDRNGASNPAAVTGQAKALGPQVNGGRSTEESLTKEQQLAQSVQRETDAELLASAADAAKQRSSPATSLQNDTQASAEPMDSGGKGSRDRLRPAESSERNAPLLKQDFRPPSRTKGSAAANGKDDSAESRGQKRRPGGTDEGSDTSTEPKTPSLGRKKGALASRKGREK